MKILRRIARYLSEVWGEVKPGDGKVSWPNRDEVRGSTWVVVVTVGILGLYLGVVDLIVGYLMSAILGFR